MHRIARDIFAVHPAQRTLRRSGRVGVSDEPPQFGDGIRPLQQHHHAGPRCHEIDEPTEKLPPPVYGIKLLGIVTAHADQAHGEYPEAVLQKSVDYPARNTHCNGIRLDDGESPLFHGELHYTKTRRQVRTRRHEPCKNRSAADRRTDRLCPDNRRNKANIRQRGRPPLSAGKNPRRRTGPPRYSSSAGRAAV